MSAVASVEPSSYRRDPAATLPPFPWDTIAAARDRAAAHPDGLIDLSIGAPADRTPPGIRAALADAADWPGYPPVHGSDELRTAYADWLARNHGVAVDPAAVLPTIGSKELVASLPTQLGLGAGDAVVIPALAYPTYEVGVRMAGAELIRATAEQLLDIDGPALIWLNSPSNPTGAVIEPELLCRIVSRARAVGAVVASDECYLDLGWEVAPQSILHPDICDGDHTGLLAVHSLSKRSNLAGYRLGFVTGDEGLVDRLLQLRKHLGLIVPGPVQAAGVAALGDDAPVMAQLGRYRRRREVLLDALQRAGFEVSDSQAGMYLWCTAQEPAAETVDWFADRGMLVAPGTFYGPGGSRHVRLSLTVTDEHALAAAARICW